jgi:hypothetical protein
MANPSRAAAASGRRELRDRCPVTIQIEDDGLVSINSDDAGGFKMGINRDDIQKYNGDFVKTFEELRSHIVKNGTWDLSGNEHETTVESFLVQVRNLALQVNSSFQIHLFLEKFRALQQGTQMDLSLSFHAKPEMTLWWNTVYASAAGEDSDSKVVPERFWGLEYPISITHPSRHLIPMPKIRAGDGVYCATHKGLRQPGAEVKTITGLVDRAREAYALQDLSSITIDQDPELPLAELSPTALLKRFQKDSFRYGIVHFACHCDNPTNKSVRGACLVLTVSGRPIELSVATLKELISAGGFSSKPLVFLNACATSNLLHMETVNFPSSFMDFRASAVIGTACTVPDDFACAFAEEFYQRLFKLTEEDLKANTPLGELKSNIGEALLATRRYFLAKYRNPLGLAYSLYSFYAEPELRVW